MGFSTMVTYLIGIILFLGSLICAFEQDDLDFAPEGTNRIPDDIDHIGEIYSKERTEEDLRRKSDVLAKLLLLPWPQDASPLLYVEEPQSLDNLRREIFDSADPSEPENNEQELRPMSSKRSKYYRKYPWKRQNNRYEPAYMCIPKKDDVYRLLVALHTERNGKRGQLVDFCNRKRPASLVFTNIRFVG
ncbi:uncharacterized protein LOC143203260 [Rhynchophorus ferrugineus]|uniref:uncharacterized protein LOC143203260 n=1 Tax=Rhynchophorus ferrugineus TaxID=354439 RepID=UPI003FCC87A6